jgi:hypothetical protein
MAERLSWWVIPGALLVLWRVVLLETPAGVVEGPAPVVQAPAAVDVARGPVIVRDASGVRSTPSKLPIENALVLYLPLECVGQRVQLSMWRQLDGVREAKPWLEATPRVRADALLPIGGQPAGLYDLEVVYGSGTEATHLVRHGVVAPGTVDLTMPANSPINSAPISGRR